ncbi:MAG TPA: carboxypeptidase-like regulatory domain-containing protein, partial [Pyrinomonadaceae bacterium]|nr:carboxypeptidase-like regulatory domain-containing protein [Pyrinomonadaceae bacterium]
MFSSTRVILTSLFILLALSSALAQGGTGQLSGSVADTNGAVVSGANVKLTSLVTAQEREAVTNDAGDFVFTLLPAGAYKLEITANGFRTVVVDEVRINVTQTTTLPVRLDAATVSGMVTINAEPPLVQQETSQVGRTIEENTIRQLPLPTRNFQQLLTLSPGTSSSVANNTELGRGDAIISVNGQRTTSNNVRINGIDANSIGTNSTPNIAV